MVGIFTGDELPVIEADAVVEQQFDVVHNQRLAVLVDGILQLRPYLFHTFDYSLALLLRKMQRFVGVI